MAGTWMTGSRVGEGEGSIHASCTFARMHACVRVRLHGRPCVPGYIVCMRMRLFPCTASSSGRLKAQQPSTSRRLLRMHRAWLCLQSWLQTTQRHVCPCMGAATVGIIHV